jgi:hypothetical protein
LRLGWFAQRFEYTGLAISVVVVMGVTHDNRHGAVVTNDPGNALAAIVP